MKKVTRRKFISDSAVLAGGSMMAAKWTPRLSAAEGQTAGFQSQWHRTLNRVWVGPEFWANPLQDWRIANGRLECAKGALNRNVQLLTRQLTAERGELRTRVVIGRVGDNSFNQGKGSAGFRIGIQGPLREYRNSLVRGNGLDAGLTAAGVLFLDKATLKLDSSALELKSVELRLSAEPDGDAYSLGLSAHDAESGRRLGRIIDQPIPAGRLIGNLALVANFPNPPEGKAGAARFWFSDWQVTGSKLAANENQQFGPILFSQYTLSRGILKMTAQMPPIGENESQTVRLQLPKGLSQSWSTVTEASIHPQARTATFRVENWNDKVDTPYRLVYTMKYSDGRKQDRHFTGKIRKDPVNQQVLSVADISCNHHDAFPNHQYTANTAKLDPDLIAFVGDQFYESSGGYGIVRSPLEPAILDYLHKWYMHGWTWRELTRDRPSIAIPDDHDVYHGNIWGEGGAARQGALEKGGYTMDPAWVNVVHRTQTAHHPDPYDPTPVKQNISVYYGPMTYGGVSFAILADRMFKTGPDGVAPPTNSRADHVTDPDFDPKTADVPGAVLLGDRQLRFLNDWITDWRGAEMKAVISQTIFTAMATHHGGGHRRLYADYDTNGWPQSPRNEALRILRKAFPVHLAGDQHLPAVVHYGIEEHGDAPVSFAGPAVNVGYPRWWEPDEPGANRPPWAPDNTGDFTDHFGHPLTVKAVANGARNPRGPVLERMQDKASGLGLVHFDKARKRITIECWPYLADPTEPGTQFTGWPVTFDQLDNYGRKPVAYLPTLEITGIEKPLVQVIDETDYELVYNLRLAEPRFQPHVFTPGQYSVEVLDPESNRRNVLRGLDARSENHETMKILL